MLDLWVREFELIWLFLNLDSQFNWEWIAGKIGLNQLDVKMIQGSSIHPSQLFLSQWSERGATTSQLLTLLAGKRVDIIEELAKSYIIP